MVLMLANMKNKNISRKFYQTSSESIIYLDIFVQYVYIYIYIHIYSCDYVGVYVAICLYTYVCDFGMCA